VDDLIPTGQLQTDTVPVLDDVQQLNHVHDHIHDHDLGQYPLT
jgi:hypothetical protein